MSQCMIVTTCVGHIDLAEACLVKNFSGWGVGLVALLGADGHLGHYLAECSLIQRPWVNQIVAYRVA